MGFFYIEQEKPKRSATPAKARLEDIPVTLLREQSCKVCPRDKDTKLQSPKMRPTGPKDALIYLLGAGPTDADDRDDGHWRDAYGREVVAKFGKRFMDDEVRSNYIVQCHGEEHVVVTECCRNRVIADIENTRPSIVVTVGDAALKWATGIDKSAPQVRGSLFVSQFGSHMCHVMPIITPNYVIREWGKQYQSGKIESRFALSLIHDIAWVKKHYRDMPNARVHTAYDANIEYITGDQPGDIHRLEKRLREMARYPRSAIDLETSCLRPYMPRHSYILTAAVGTFDDTLAFPLRISSAGHDEGWGTVGREQQAMEMFAEYIIHSGKKCAHNLAFEQEWIAHDFGSEVLRRTEWDDTMAMAYVMDGRPGTKGLDMQTRMHFGFNLKDQSPVNVKLDQWWLRYRLKDILRYNGMDTKWTDALRDKYSEHVLDAAGLRVYEQRVRLAPALVQMEEVGLPLDFDYARTLDDEMRAKLKDTETKLTRCSEVKDYERKFGRFEPTNTDHVLKLMDAMLKREECRREDRDGTVTLTTDEEALSSIPSSEVPSARLILDHREIAKLHGTYVLPALKKKWVCRDGRVRSKYSSLTAITGRLSSEDTNQQNWPKRKHKHVRGMVYAGKGRWLVPADYGQIEFRVVGMCTQDANLVKYCWTDYDVHKYWAQRMIKLHPPIQDYAREEFAENIADTMAKNDGDEDKAILKVLRQEAKNRWVFPQFFGSTAHSCAVGLHIPDDVANELQGEFWDEFKGVKKWQDDLVKFYNRHFYVETLGGHKRRGLMTINELINHPIQGTAAEIVQQAQIVLSERADAEGDPELQPVMNVHDDLTFNISDDNLESKIEVIAREMCLPRFDYINVPLLVEVSAGERWDQCQELRVYRSNELFNTPNPYV